MRAAIIGSGLILEYDYIGKVLQGAEVIICCDGGAHHAKMLNLTPDIIVGDLDSIDNDVYEHYLRVGVKYEKYSPMKDNTDMEIGLNKAFELNAAEIIFAGATGNRADHTLSNIGLLYTCLKRGVKASIIDDNNKIMLIDKKTVLPLKSGQTVSLLTYTDNVSGVTTTGLQYPLHNDTLVWGTTRGISNVCLSENSTVSLEKGVLIVVIPLRP